MGTTLEGNPTGNRILPCKSNIPMTSNTQLISRAFSALSPVWLVSIGIVLVEGIVNTAASSLVFGVLSLAITGPMLFGNARCFLAIGRGQEVQVSMLFDGFKYYVNTMLAGILFTLAVVVGLILLFIPGIVIGVGLSQTFYIMSDNPEMECTEALKESWNLVMKGGFFWKVFGMGVLQFFVILAGLIALIIGVLFAVPVVYTASALLYDEIKASRLVLS